MKSFIQFALVMSMLTVGSANEGSSKVILDKVTKLSHLAFGYTETKVRGKNAVEMIKDLALRINKVEEFKLENYQIPGIDESSGQYGLAGADDVADLIKDGRNGSLSPAQEKFIHDLLKEAKRAGAVFAYTSDGSSVCGVSFPDALIIDVEAGKIYQIYSVGGTC